MAQPIASSEITYSSFPSFVQQFWLPLTSKAGFPLATYKVASAIPPRGLLFFCHGFLDCSIDGNRFSYDMAQAGFEVLSFDFIGHGQSGGPRGYFSSLDLLAEDVSTYVSKAKEVYGSDLPVFLSGYSLGGAAVILASLKVQVQGLLLFAPALGSLLLFECSFISLLAYFSPLTSVSQTSSDSKPSTRNSKAMLEIPQSGLYNYEAIPVGTLKAVLDGLEQLMGLAGSISTPCAIAQGGADYFVCKHKAKKFYDSLGTSDKEYWFFPAMHHGVLFEPEYDEVLERCKAWLSLRV